MKTISLFCVAIAAAALLGSCSKEPSFKIGSITPTTVEVYANKEAVVGNLKENGYQVTIPAGTFDGDVTISVSPPSSEAESAYKSTGKFERLASPIEIHVEGTQGTVWLNEMATVSFPFPSGFSIKPDNFYRIYGSMYNPETKTVDYITPDPYELLQGRITFFTMHFSEPCPVLLKETEACNKFAYDRAESAIEDEKKKEETQEMLGDAFREIYAKMGITDKTLTETLIKGVISETNLGTLAVGIFDGEAGTIASTFPEMAGSFLLKHMKVSNMTEIAIRTTNPNLIAGVGNAIQEVAKGNYAEAGIKLAEAAVEWYFPPYKFLKIANELINYSVIRFYKSQQKEIYEFFKKAGNSIDDDIDWTIATGDRFVSLMNNIEKDVIAAYCKANNIPRSSLSNAEIQELKLNASRDLRKMLRERLANEARIKQKQDEYLDIIKHFKDDGLLDRFSYFTDIDNRLGRMFIWRDVVLNMVGGPLKSDNWKFNSAEDNLRWATEQYAKMVWEWGCEKKIPGGELAFYDWLVKEGFIKAGEFDLAGCFGTYKGEAKVVDTYSVGSTGSNSTSTETRIIYVYIKDVGQGRMSIDMGEAEDPLGTGAITLQGNTATFSFEFPATHNPDDFEIDGHCNGTIKIVDNKYTLSGTIFWHVWHTYDTSSSTREHTFTNLVKQ